MDREDVKHTHWGVFHRDEDVLKEPGGHDARQTSQIKAKTNNLTDT